MMMGKFLKQLAILFAPIVAQVAVDAATKALTKPKKTV
jgi:hypothetical protein